MEQFQLKKTEYVFNEYKQIGVDFANVKEVETYDVKQGTNEELDRALLKRLGVSKTDTLIDFGCGTGSFVCQAGLCCKKVYAVDISKPMLEFTEQRCLKSNVKNVEFRCAGFLTYEHTGEPLDFAFTRAALHHLPDFWKVVALQRIHSILKPGGIFYLADAAYSFEPSDYKSGIEEWINTFGRDDGKGFTKADFAMHVREEFSTYTWLLEAILEKAGFEILEKVYPRKTKAEYVCKKRF